MIEYLSALATVLLLFITVASLLVRKRLDLQEIWEGVERMKDVLEFIGNLPRWLNYYNDLSANVQYLKDRRDRLMNRKDDLTMRVEEKEIQTGRSTKKEVDNWLSSVETKDNEVQALLGQVEREANRFSQFLYRAWLGNHVEKRIQEVDDLYSTGVFEEVLSPVREATELVVRQLVGGDANENIRKILGWLLVDNNVTIIGIHGIKGIGKTAIMMHIHNQLLKNGNLHVYMIQVPEDSTQYGLQSCIANELFMDLQEEDVMKRAALLDIELGRRNFVLILDGLKKYFPIESVGIPLDATQGKMIITSRSPHVCRKMGCQKTIEVLPLPNDDALELFKQKLELSSLAELPVDLAEQIVEQCRGVALKIVNKATHLKGVDDISVWERDLYEMRSAASASTRQL